MNYMKNNVSKIKRGATNEHDEAFFGKMKSFLESYRTCRKICDSYKAEYDAGIIPISEADDRERVYRSCRRRCDQVKEFIDSLSIELEKKKMLELHYLYGYTVERCADQLYLSRSTAFRIKKRAEDAACDFYFTFLGKVGDIESVYSPESA